MYQVGLDRNRPVQSHRDHPRTGLVTGCDLRAHHRLHTRLRHTGDERRPRRDIPASAAGADDDRATGCQRRPGERPRPGRIRLAAIRLPIAAPRRLGHSGHELFPFSAGSRPGLFRPCLHGVRGAAVRSSRFAACPLGSLPFDIADRVCGCLRGIRRPEYGHSELSCRLRR